MFFATENNRSLDRCPTKNIKVDILGCNIIVVGLPALHAELNFLCIGKAVVGMISTLIIVDKNPHIPLIKYIIVVCCG